MSKETIRIGISSCLLGQQVRFDGGHKHDTLITEMLGRFFQWVPVCPEVEIGLGTPRESLRLVGIAESPRLIAPAFSRSELHNRTEPSGRRRSEPLYLRKQAVTTRIQRVIAEQGLDADSKRKSARPPYS